MTETIHLLYLEPWDWQQFHRHFALRLLPGVERLTCAAMPVRCAWVMPAAGSV